MYCSPPLSQRMIIGLRAFLLIADSLEKDEGDPPMPMNAGPLQSGGTPRLKTKFLSTTLADETAKKIGIAPFYPTSVDTALTSCLHWFSIPPSSFLLHSVRRALQCILHALDQSIGRTLICTIPQVTGRSVEEVLR